MTTAQAKTPIAHFVGSIPLPDAETVFRTLSGAVGSHAARLPDGETGIRKMWIKFLQDVLADHPAIELADDVPPFKFTQWDGKVVREIPRLRLIEGIDIDPEKFLTGYADMAIDSWAVFKRLQDEGVIPPHVKFQISIPTPTAPTYNNMVPHLCPELPDAQKDQLAYGEKIPLVMTNVALSNGAAVNTYLEHRNLLKQPCLKIEFSTFFAYR